MKPWLLRLICLTLIAILSGCAVAPPGETATQPAPASSPAPVKATLSFLNIGKGDALLFTAPDGGYYMIDTGRAEDFPLVMQALGASGVTRLEGVILTHGHKDHMGGLEGLLKAMPINAVYVNASDTVTYKAGQLEGMLAGYETRLTGLRVGDTLDLGGVRATVLAPTSLDTENENNNSLVIMLTHGQTRMLLMGDAEAAVEKLLLASQQNLRAQVLKAGHHGKDDATTEAFLQAVSPEHVILTGSPQEDADSPGGRVLALMEQSEIDYAQSTGEWLMQHYQSDGTHITTGQTLPPADASPLADLVLDGIDRKAELVRVKNTAGEALDLSGCWIFSEVGSETYFFPQGTRLNPGETVTVTSGNAFAQGDLSWTEQKVWKAKGDPALLFDRQGRLLSRLD